MILEQPTELSIFDIFHRGVPNKECIAISIHSSFNIAQYGIILGTTSSESQMAVPIKDKFFWFGEGQVNAGDWIFLYTGSGETSVIPTIDGLTKSYSLYWGHSMTMLYDSNIVPILFRMDAVQVASASRALPQT